MKRLLRFLWTGDWHLCVWEDAGKERITYGVDENGNKKGDLPVERRQPMKCKICGKRKSFIL